jgi:hypothetical protein
MPDRSTLDEVSPPLPTPPRRKRRVLALIFALGLGLAGGLNLHRFVNLDETGRWLGHVLQSSFEWARKEVAATIESFTKRPLTVAQASSPSPVAGAGQPPLSKEPAIDALVDRMISDLSGRVDQVRAANENSTRDLNQGFERLRITAEQSQRELTANLARLGERLDRIERQSAGTVPMITPTPTPPVVQSAAPPPVRSPVKVAAKPVSKPVPEVRTKVGPKQSSTGEADAKGIANWTVLEVIDGTAVLKGPRGLVEVSRGDIIPGIGRVEAILRSGRRWVVATTKGVITP